MIICQKIRKNDSWEKGWGKNEKWFSEVCLLDQPFVKNPDITIEEYLRNTANDVGENIKIRRFARFEVGEGLEKKKKTSLKKFKAKWNRLIGSFTSEKRQTLFIVGLSFYI